MFLPDINVWLALTFRSHPHHSAASDWFEEVPDDSCAFCRMTQQRFLRLASNPRVMGTDALTLQQAWEKFDIYLADPRVWAGHFISPRSVAAFWRKSSASEFTASFGRPIKNQSSKFMAPNDSIIAENEIFIYFSPVRHLSERRIAEQHPLCLTQPPRTAA